MLSPLLIWWVFKYVVAVAIPPFPCDVLSESLLHLPLWMIFRHMRINLINVRSMYAS